MSQLVRAGPCQRDGGGGHQADEGQSGGVAATSLPAAFLIRLLSNGITSDIHLIASQQQRKITTFQSWFDLSRRIVAATHTTWQMSRANKDDETEVSVHAVSELLRATSSSPAPTAGAKVALITGIAGACELFYELLF